MKRIVSLFLKILCFFSVILLSGCKRLDSITAIPKQTPEQFLNTLPYMHINIFSLDFILTQPSSTILIYALGIISIIVGIHFIKTRNNQRSRLWWGIGILLWGFSAICAGTSYQAFTYELKCLGREYCIWTSSWEVTYLVLTVLSMNSIMIAQCYACTIGKLRKVLKIYSVISTVSYIVIIIIGVLIPVKFLISFELLVLFLFPNAVIFISLNSWQYYKNKDHMNLYLLFSWGIFAASMIAYYIYLVLGITEKLWTNGIWFSENDILHVFLIIWIIYLGKVVNKEIKDIEHFSN